MNINKSLLKSRINELGMWLYTNEGLNMMVIINELLDGYKTNLNESEIIRFNEGLDILRKTNFPNIDGLLKYKIPEGIENQKLVKINESWSFVNKLNTNYSDLSELLVFVIGKMMIDTNINVVNYSTDIYNTIMVDTISGLMKFKPKLKGAIEYCLIKNGNGLSDFLLFTENIKRNSLTGELSEDSTVNYLISKGFDICYRGGNGDFIDMLFGCDIIVYREDYGYKTVQVKSYKPSDKQLYYYKVNWLSVSRNGITTITDLKNKFEIKFQ